MNPDDSDVSRQNKIGRNIDDIHSIDGSLVMTGVTADDDDDREGNAHVMMMQMLMLSILTMASKPRILLNMMMIRKHADGDDKPTRGW